MNVLIIGSGGREHALAWRLSLDKSCEKVVVWPGNVGMTGPKIQTVETDFSKNEFNKIINDQKITFVVPGSEKYLYEGVSDWCSEINIKCFGPSQKASRLEQSKIYSKNLMQEAGIKTASYKDLTSSFNRDLNEAFSVVKNFLRPVIKISGPSLGKGVFVCDTHDEAFGILKQLKENPIPGMEDGLLVEEGVSGKEVSVFFACNGTDFKYLGSAQDHKRLLDQDKGPNTGGMGAFSPVHWADENYIKMVTEKFLKPSLNKMVESGIPFTGILFLGLMTDGEETNLLEYNTRFGDPETQVILPLIEGDFTQFLFNFLHSKESHVVLKNECAIHVVKAARGYPGTFGTSIEKNKSIHITQVDTNHSQLFFAGVRKDGEELLTSGGRVLGMTSWGKNLEEARTKVYESLKKVHFDGEQFRQDIGQRP